MKQYIGLHRFLKRGTECGDKGMGQVADEPYRIRNHEQPVIRDKQFAGGGVQSSKQLVGDVGVAAGKAIKQRGFTGVGIADYRNRHYLGALPGTALYFSLTLKFSKFFLEHLNPLPEQAPVSLQLGFARTTQSYTAFLPLQMSPSTYQASGKMFKLRKFHLQLTFMAFRALGKDI